MTSFQLGTPATWAGRAKELVENKKRPGSEGSSGQILWCRSCFCCLLHACPTPHFHISLPQVHSLGLQCPAPMFCPSLRLTGAPLWTEFCNLHSYSEAVALSVTISGKPRSIKEATTVTLSNNGRSHRAAVLTRQRGNTGTYAHRQRPCEDTAR